MLVKGWKYRMKEILDQIPDSQKHEVRPLLEQLGNKIGPEWAKENRARRIDTAMLQRWGDDLMAARSKGKDTLIETIYRIDRDVDLILA